MQGPKSIVMPSKRADLFLQRPEESHPPTMTSPDSMSSSPPMAASPMSPLSPLPNTSAKDGHNQSGTVRSPARSITWDSLFTRARSKSPRPRHGDQQQDQLPSPPLQGASPLSQSQTTPAMSSTSRSPSLATNPQQRHKSDGAISPQLMRGSSEDSSFFQKRRKERGSLDHYGRHGNDWLFGGISLRETAKGLVQKRREG